MSRIGKKPISIPTGVEIALNGCVFEAKYQNNYVKVNIPAQANVTCETAMITVTLHPTNTSTNVAPVLIKRQCKNAAAVWGTTRALISNAIEGVTKKFSKKLEIVGVGYRAEIKNNILTLRLGFSHEKTFAIPEDVTITCETPTVVRVDACNKERVGLVTSKIKDMRPPNPYSGDGIRYFGQKIVCKEGKKK